MDEIILLNSSNVLVVVQKLLGYNVITNCLPLSLMIVVVVSSSETFITVD